jgi:hypothetical protein
MTEPDASLNREEERLMKAMSSGIKAAGSAKRPPATASVGVRNSICCCLVQRSVECRRCALLGPSSDLNFWLSPLVEWMANFSQEPPHVYVALTQEELAFFDAEMHFQHVAAEHATRYLSFSVVQALTWAWIK